MAAPLGANDPSSNQTLSRRRFAQLLGAGLAGAAAARAARAVELAPAAAAPATAAATAASVAPATAAAGTAALGAAPSRGAFRAGAVRLSANENPYGPSAAAFDAMRGAFPLAWRYPDEHADALVEEIARQHGVARTQVLLGAGSGEILRLCAVAFTGAGRPVVTAEPTFESLARHARRNGAEALAVPLTADFRHDLPRMLDAAPDPGLLYVCNPNNPTASITPKSEVRGLLAKLPPRTMALVDEAYFHYVESDDYETVVPLVASHPGLVVTRTFSKVHGMAGMRCGYAVAQPEVIALLRTHQAFDNVNVLAMAAAHASLLDPDHVALGRRRNSETRAAVCAELDRAGFRYIPSHANFLMIDLRRPVAPVIHALAERNVEVGRLFPALPNHLRVTIGKPEQMEVFLPALRAVTAV
jgi:histidinol-phosphate aminotransferase